MKMRVGFAEDLNVSSRSVQDFYERNWPKKIALSDSVFYDWQFRQPPANLGKDSCVIAYDDEKGAIVGAMGLHRRSFYLNNVEKRGAELTTWVVAQDRLGGGSGARILQFIQSQFEVLIGMGISAMALSIYMRSGFRYLRAIPRFIKVINFKSIEKYSISDKISKRMISNQSIPMFLDYDVRKIGSVREVDDCGIYLRSMNHFSRDAEHLSWRYSAHPYFEFRHFIVSSIELSGSEVYVALREERSLSEFKVLHVMDIFGAPEMMGRAVRFIEKYAGDNGFDAVDFYCTSSGIYRFFIASGWFSINDDLGFRFPHLFHPVEMRDPPTTSLIYWASGAMHEMADVSRLYITKQDADLDRPTQHTIGDLVA